MKHFKLALPLLVWHFVVVGASGWARPSLLFVPLDTHSSSTKSDALPEPSGAKTSLLARPLSDDAVDVEEMTATGEVLELQTKSFYESPAKSLASLSEACGRLGVDDFDVYGDFDLDEEHSYLRRFEAEVASHFGKEDGVFCLSGGMAQSIALLINAKIHRSARDGDVGGETMAFACHPTSHLLLHENDGFSKLLGMEAVVVSPDFDSAKGKEATYYDPQALKDDGCYGMEPIRLSHLQKMFSSSDGGSTIPLTYPNLKQIRSSDISTLILELPHREIGGKLSLWEEVEEISRMCRKLGMHYHCDGARIFEASVGYGHKSVKETAQPFSSVYVSFYKGLGAISGAMLLGDSDFCSEARVWLRRMGGNLKTVLPYAVSSWDGFRKTCLTDVHTNGEGEARDRNPELVYDTGVFENRRRKLARVLELLRADERITSIVQFDPAVPETNMVHGYLRMSHDECMAALEEVESSTGIRVLSRVCSVGSDGEENANNQPNFGCRFEWLMGESNSLIEDDHFVFGWSKFAQVVIGGKKYESSA